MVTPKFYLPMVMLGMLLLFSCQTSHMKQENNRINADPSIIKNEIITQLINLDVIEGVELDFKKYRFKSEKVLSPHMKAVVFTYDTTRITPAKMMYKLNRDDRFVTVEFNKIISVRDR